MTQSVDWHLVATALNLAEAITSGGIFFPSYRILVAIYLSFSALCRGMMLEQEKEAAKGMATHASYRKKYLGACFVHKTCSAAN